MTVGPAPAELVRRRDRLARELAELQYDLGGLAYEMAIRDHFRVDALVRVAARMQELDAELGEIERLVKLEGAGAGGSCPACAALHGRGAFFCWRCGGRLITEIDDASPHNTPFTTASPTHNTR